MPAIDALPSDNAPDPADLVAFVDVSTDTTEASTLADLAASSAFASQYATITSQDAVVAATQRILIPARSMVATDATATTGKASLWYPYYEFDDSANDSVATTIDVETIALWDSVTLDLYLANLTADAGTVRIECGLHPAGDGVTPSTAVELTLTVTWTAGANGVITKATATTNGTLVTLAGPMIFRVRRVPGSPSDTKTGSVAFHSAVLRGN